MLKRLFFGFYTFYAAAAFCDSPSAHSAELLAYGEGEGKGRLLGSGSFGSVYEFTLDDKTYAVKEIDLRSNLDRFLASRKVSREVAHALSRFYAMIESDERVKDTPSEDQVAQLVESTWPDQGEIQRVLLQYFSYFASESARIGNEAEVMRKISQSGKPAVSGDGGNEALEFCVRMSNTKYLIFQKVHYKALADPESLGYILRLPVGQRFKLYLAILRQVRLLHDLGIVHCDIQPGNIMWADARREDVVMIDFGLSQFSQLCRGGTEGLTAPEVLDPRLAVLADGGCFKADVYSLGSMIASAEFMASGSDLNFAMEQKLLQDTNMLSLLHGELMKKLEAAISKEAQKARQAYPDTWTSRQTYYDLFGWTIKQMLVKDVSNRADLSAAYKYMWRVYQIAQLLDGPVLEFTKKSELIASFLSKWSADGRSAFDLPLELPAEAELDLIEDDTSRSAQPGQGRLLI